MAYPPSLDRLYSSLFFYAWCTMLDSIRGVVYLSTDQKVMISYLLFHKGLDNAECFVTVIIIPGLETVATHGVARMTMTSLKQVEFACEGVLAGHEPRSYLLIPPSEL
jgi:hypothetical protein